MSQFKKRKKAISRAANPTNDVTLQNFKCPKCDHLHSVVVIARDATLHCSACSHHLGQVDKIIENARTQAFAIVHDRIRNEETII